MQDFSLITFHFECDLRSTSQLWVIIKMIKKTINYVNTQNSKQSLDENSPSRQKARPTSPHIQVYKWEWSMAYSILHRISAIGVGVLMLITIIILVTGKDYAFYETLETPFGKMIYLVGIFCILYYIFATIKYMIWQTGRGLDLKSAKRLGDASLIATIVCTIGVVCNAFIF